MKAKLYFNKLKENTTEVDFFKFYESMMYDLVKEAEDLILTRNAKRNESIRSCIMEIDNKYRAICRLIEKYKEEVSEDHFIKNIKFLDDGFKAIYVELHPEHRWFFDIDKHKKMIADINEENEAKKKRLNNFYLHKVTPFEELTMENLTSEILCCLQSLGSFSSIIDGKTITMEAARPLAYRITLLRWWLNKGEINLEDVKEWESNKEKWCRDHFV